LARGIGTGQSKNPHGLLELDERGLITVTLTKESDPHPPPSGRNRGQVKRTYSANLINSPRAYPDGTIGNRGLPFCVLKTWGGKPLKGRKDTQLSQEKSNEGMDLGKKRRENHSSKGKFF